MKLLKTVLLLALHGAHASAASHKRRKLKSRKAHK